MALFPALTLFLTACYVLLFLLYLLGFLKSADFESFSDFIPKTTFSIVIPARNEKANIKRCLDSILSQNYDPNLFEILVVNDHSTDSTAAIVQNYKDSRVRLINLADHTKNEPILSYKKKAITTAIAFSMGEIIVTTDADCIAPPNWLRTLAASNVSTSADMIIAPVTFQCDGSILQIFQTIDFMTMQGITIAANKLHLGSMCNGANLALSKRAFFEVNGYEGVEHLASGDDYLLMLKFKKGNHKIVYLKSRQAIMTTLPQLKWADFLQQRIRWASKSGKYDDPLLTVILMVVYLFNFSLLLLPFFSPLKFIALIFTLKVTVEIIFLIPVANFFKQPKLLLHFVFLQPLHIIYIVLAGLLGFAGKYSWKGRIINQKTNKNSVQ